MLGFILRRIALLVPTFLGITLAAFRFIHFLPGDPVLLMAGERGISDERHAELMHRFGFDRPIWQQYFDYLWSALHGDLGQSLVTKRPVFHEFFTLFPATLELSICAIIFAIALGIPAGVIAAVRRGSMFDHAVMGTALVGYSMPIFWWALLLIIVFSGMLEWTPVSGRIALLYYFKPVTGFMLIDSLLSGQKGAFHSAVSHLVLPAIVLATIPLAVIARQTRSAMLEVLGEDYVRTARAKGLSPGGWSACMRSATPHPGRDHHRPSGRRPPRRRNPDRDDLFLARHRQVDGRFDLPPRLPVGAGRAAADRHDCHVRQPAVDVLYGLINPRIRHAKVGRHGEAGGKGRRTSTSDAAVALALLGVLALFQRERGRRGRPCLLGAPLLVAIFADFIAPHSPTMQYRDALLSPAASRTAASGASCSAPMPSAAMSSPG